MAVLLRYIIANGLCVVNVKRSESESESESASESESESESKNGSVSTRRSCRQLTSLNTSARVTADPVSKFGMNGW